MWSGRGRSWESPLYRIGRPYLFCENDLDLAEKRFRECLGARIKGWWPQRADAHWQLAMIYNLRGRTDLAIEELKMARELNPRHKKSKEMLKEIKRQKRIGKR